ncbi:MAG: YtxH domain-containing protein [Christensenellales bacterium]
MDMKFISGIIAGSILGITAAATVMLAVPQLQGEAARNLIRSGKNLMNKKQKMFHM